MEEMPVYGTEPEPESSPVTFREVFDILWELVVLGVVVGFLAGAPSNYVKLLLVPMAVPSWVLLRRLADMCRRIFSA